MGVDPIKLVTKEDTMPRILIAEDDEFLRDILKDYLEDNGYKVTAVPDGKTARDVVMAGEFALVISDVQMPFLNGVELLQWLRSKSQIPFILMTGFTNLLETHQAAEMGANGFLSKPFSNKELLALIKSLLEPKKNIEPVANGEKTVQQEYCKVSIEEFVAKPKLDYDIYVCLQETKYLKIARSGETLDVSRLNTYRNKGLAFFHIKKEDFKKLVDFNMGISKMLQQNQSVPTEKKLRFMRYTSEVILEHCFVDDMNKATFDEAHDFFKTSMALFSENSETYSLLEILNGHSDSIYAHSLGVSLYSVIIAKKLNFNSPQIIFKLAMAGLFHDIGKKEIDKRILDTPRPQLSVEDRKMYESHVQRGRDIMQSIPNIPQDVIQMIHEHHEDEVGQGYPSGTAKNRMHPLSCVIHLADKFVSHVVKNPTHHQISGREAVFMIEKFEGDRVNKNALAALKALVFEIKAA
jgi:putative nucleotidyltransferase with HDIG domain